MLGLQRVAAPCAARHSLGCMGLLALVGLFGACIIDEGDTCSDGQTLTGGLCLCPAGATVVNNSCANPPIDAGGGMLDAALQLPEGGLGASCEPSRPCSDARYASCQQAPSGERYCTSAGCTSSGDCPSGYSCMTGSSPSYCRRPYVGQEQPCTSSSMCTGDATFCSPLLSVCMVPGCSDGSCDPGFTCFKASMYSPGTPDVCVKGERLPP